MPSDPAAIAHAVLDAWNTHDLPRFLDMLTEDVEWYDPAMPHPPAVGRPAVRAFAESVLRAFPDFRYDIREPLCVSTDGTRCVVPWRITATHVQPLTPPGYAPTGRQLTIDGLDQLDLRDGQVARILTCFDVIVAAEQLLSITLRPKARSWRQRFLVGLQRAAALRARRLTRA
ncbi:MAG: ester cyclase [Gemmatimonadota bacterium]|nr:ester cyclase [Gemmatimonadota bacterium]MDH3369030.1 ester cyclase [Gemmatimonadota bacterium]MDH3479955.1 ester cyclase [Gemmatimonadota bacterium]MDH3570321.1 ester cyclase [Gemmatimonadota bacterium]MDH5551274.1 ester cyclase [Gemmatimonadota bacterium]